MQERFFYSPDQGSRSGGFSQKEQEKAGQIDRLSGVFRVAGSRRYGDESAFIGWTKDDQPTVAMSETQLTQQARESYTNFQISGLAIKRISYKVLTAAEYVSTGSAVDFQDKGSKKAEDLLTYQIMSAGNHKSIAIPELMILQAIIEASDDPWQEIGHSKIGDLAVTAKSMFTLFLPTPNAGEGTVLAVLFKPVIEDESNESAFKGFIRQTLGRLLILDESQVLQCQKGYVKAAAGLAGSKSRGTGEVILRSLKNLGFIDYDEESLEGIRRTGREFKAKMLGLVNFFVDVGEGRIEEAKHPRPYYDIDSLDVEQLVELSRRMLAVGQRYLRRS